jgi:hypothetical protein
MKLYKTIKIEKSKWLELKGIALSREKTLQDIVDEALFLYLKEKNK